MVINLDFVNNTFYTKKNGLMVEFNKYTYNQNKLYFTNLSKYGLIFIKYLHDNKIIYTVNVYNYEIYGICIDECIIIKCYSLFLNDVVELSQKNEDIEYWLYKLQYTIKNYLHIDIFHKKYFSLSGVIVDILKNFNKNIFVKYDKNIENYIRNGYYGGRCELFCPGKYDKLYYFDFPQMYGNLLLEKLPFKRGYFKEVISYEFFLENEGFYDVTINQPYTWLPLLPHRHIINDSLVFCTGEWRATFWSEELKFFLKNGGQLLKIHGGVIFDSLEAELFTVALYLIKLRTHNDFCKKVFKVLLNQIYGRLGIRTEFYKTGLFISYQNEKIFLNNNIKRYKNFDNIFLVEYNEHINKKTEANIAVAAAITAKARVKLMTTLLNLKKNNIKIVYCDTDSIFIDTDTIDSLKSENNYKWTEINDINFISENNYYFTQNNNKKIINSGGNEGMLKRYEIKIKETRPLKFIKNGYY